MVRWHIVTSAFIGSFAVVTLLACDQGGAPAPKSHKNTNDSDSDSSLRNDPVSSGLGGNDDSDLGFESDDFGQNLDREVSQESLRVMKGVYASNFRAGFGIHQGFECEEHLIFSKPFDKDSIEVSVSYGLAGTWTDSMTCEYEEGTFFKPKPKGYLCKSADVRQRFVRITKEDKKFRITASPGLDEDGFQMGGTSSWTTRRCEVPEVPKESDRDLEDEDYDDEDEEEDYEDDDFDDFDEAP